MLQRGTGGKIVKHRFPALVPGWSFCARLPAAKGGIAQLTKAWLMGLQRHQRMQLPRDPWRGQHYSVCERTPVLSRQLPEGADSGCAMGGTQGYRGRGAIPMFLGERLCAWAFARRGRWLAGALRA